MAVPSTGELSLLGIRREVSNNDYNSSTNYTNISLEDLSDGTVATINTSNNSSDRPDQSAPHEMSEFYNYDHDLAGLGDASGLAVQSQTTTAVTFVYTEGTNSDRTIVKLTNYNGSTSGLPATLNISGFGGSFPNQYQNVDGSGTSTFTVTGGTSTFFLGGTTANVTLAANDYVAVKVQSSDGSSTGTLTGEVTGYTLPGVPTSLSTTSITTTGMTINWNAPSGGVNASNGYRYYHGTNTTATNNSAVDTGNTSVAISSLSPNTRYYWTVQAKGSGGDFGSTATQESPYTLPGVPTGLAASSVSQTGMTISWTAPSPGGADGYRLYFGTNSTVTSNTAYTQASTSKTFTGLSSSTTYYFAVQADNPDGAYGDLTSTESQATSAGTTLQLALGGKSGFTNVPSGQTQSGAASYASSTNLTDLPDIGGLNKLTISNGSGDTVISTSGMQSQVQHKINTSSNPDTGTYVAATNNLNGSTTAVWYYNVRVRNASTTATYGGTTTFTNNSVSVTRTYAFSLTILSSDIRLKENIKLIGHSDSKIPIYEFNFKKDPKKIKWTGTMAQDLLEMGREDAVITHKDGEWKGYYGVDYDKIDVDLLSENLISEEII